MLSLFWGLPLVKRIPWRKEWPPTPTVLAWLISWTEEPGRLQSRGSQRTGHDLATEQQQNCVKILEPRILVGVVAKCFIFIHTQI